MQEERSQDDDQFERWYLRHVSRRNDSLVLHGADLDADLHTTGLSARYLRIRAVGPGEEQQETLAENLLARHPRVLVRGDAGSGKTTLSHVLAVRAAQGELDSGGLHGLVPFLLPLRTIMSKGLPLPAPGQLLSAAQVSLNEGQPAGWEQRVLAAGRGLLLVDGIDEVDADRREAARRWLGELLDAYPDTRCMVTSRPMAIRAAWLEDTGFAEFHLSPMTLDDVRAFIERWHAVPRPFGDDSRDVAAMGEALFVAVAQRPELTRLATNPLMCALLCALHLQTRGKLPRGRVQLYEAALTMLLDRRDRERRVEGPEGVLLGREEQAVMLQHLAYWMHRNGRAEMSREQAVALLEEVLRGMPQVRSRAGAEQSLRHLLNRSGLLREAAAGTVEFAHRAFQDYLAAREAVESRDIGLLIGRAQEDQWEDVIQLAVGVADRRDSEELLLGILRRADREPRYRVRLVLVAGAALEMSTRLDPALRQEIVDRITDLIPPRTREGSAELARAGDLVLQLLPGPQQFRWLSPEARLVVHTAELVGSGSAQTFVQRFTALPVTDPAPDDAWVPDRPVFSLLLTDSRTTGPPSADLPAVAHHTLEFTGTEDARDLSGSADVVRKVICRGDATAPPITALPVDALHGLPLLHTLEVVNHGLLTRLGGLRDLRRLRTLRIRGCPALRDLSDLEHSSVMFLELDRDPGLAVLRGLAAARRLRVLYLPHPTGEFSADSLARHLPGVRIRAGAGFRH
ncbi:NACHT domain-containing protein [Streptomyces sp. NBC_01352]|uniref:NACHT domain-containing protein n=1 Tax=Streptomyces sp. NBC_01352 TaxID=2903834 RepID=UPI002E37C56B|nr:NACHT domain-containing protein [Streptomyces sp. NBC_01352]